jgi:hypothetical protein
MRIGCWTPKDKNIRSEYVILIDFPLQQWSRERASVLRYSYMASHVLKEYLWRADHHIEGNVSSSVALGLDAIPEVGYAD